MDTKFVDTKKDVTKGLNYPSSLAPFPCSPSDWSKAGVDETLAHVYAATLKAAQDRIDWYDRKAGTIGKTSRLLRFLGLALAGLGALMPLIAPLRPTEEWWAEAGFILLAMAGALVAFDNFFGYSDSWMRYRLTQSDLVRRLVRFRYDWAMQMASVEEAGLSRERLQALLKLHYDFIDGLEEAVERETQLWASRLQVRLAAFDRSKKFERYEEQPADKAGQGEEDGAVAAARAGPRPNGEGKPPPSPGGTDQSPS